MRMTVYLNTSVFLLFRQILESTEPSRRTTRISTGSIPRRNTPQLMGIKPDRPGLNKRLPAVEVLEDDKALVPREKTGVIKGINPEIVLNIEHLLQAANQMKQEEEANAQGPVWSMITEDPIGTGTWIGYRGVQSRPSTCNRENHI